MIPLLCMLSVTLLPLQSYAADASTADAATEDANNTSLNIELQKDPSVMPGNGTDVKTTKSNLDNSGNNKASSSKSESADKIKN